MEASGGKQAYGFGVYSMLFNLDAGGKGFFSIVVQDWYNGLNYDRSGIGSLINEMDGTSGKLHAILQCLSLGMEAWKRRKEGRVYVHDRIREGVEKDRGNDPHETRQHHQLHSMGAEQLHQGCIIGLPSCKGPMIQEMNRYVVTPGPFKGKGIGLVAYYAADPGRQGTIFYPVDDGLEVGTVS